MMLIVLLMYLFFKHLLDLAPRSSQFSVRYWHWQNSIYNKAFHVIWLGGRCSRLNCWFHILTSHSWCRCIIRRMTPLPFTLALAVCFDFCQLKIRRLNISGGLECAYMPGLFCWVPDITMRTTHFMSVSLP